MKKKLHFDNLGKQKYWKYILILCTAMIFAGMFKPDHSLNDEIYRYLFIVGLVVPILYLSRIFWYRNIIQWNNKGVIIRLDAETKSVKFENIKRVKNVDNHIIITNNDDNEIRFDLTAFDQKDVLKLVHILREKE